MAEEVSYINSGKSEIEASGYDITHTDPFLLCDKDICILLMNLRYLPDALFPLRLAKPLPGVEYNLTLLVRDYALSTILAASELVLLPWSVYELFTLPRNIYLLHLSISLCLIVTISWTMWGSRVVESQVKIGSKDCSSAERWIFMNGVGTSHCMLQTTCDMLSATFKRPIIGIHNRSYGILLDVLKCVVQRSFRYQTHDVHMVYLCLRYYLEDLGILKIFIIAHSQGGMITSMALDRLYGHVPAEYFSKMEIYTFGSVASHFHNPRRAVKRPSENTPSPSISGENASAPSFSANSDKTPPSQCSISVIEHYCNERDIVPRWGVLYHARRKPEDSYAGSVFIHNKATGHLFDSHYLETMIPLLLAHNEEDATLFLNHEVVGDTATASLRASAFPCPSSRALENMRARVSSFAPTDTSRGAPGTRVRDISKLWRYIDGGRG